jgi:hypothetical protein
VASNYENTWQYATDQFGNKIVVINWNRPAGTVTYSVDIVVKNDARFSNPSGDIGRDSSFVKETQSIVINDDIRKLAYLYGRSWDSVAKMTGLVNNIVDYDISLKGARKPSSWVLVNRRGVCVEHANLLAAMLRALDMPTRYVVGYAYSSVDKKLIGHTWVEVLDSSGDWIPFDPTWVQGGYFDATHIKTASLLDDNQSDKLSYVGSGTINWNQDDDSADSVEILGYTTRNITSIILSASNATSNGYGYVKAAVTSDICTISQLNVQSCVDATDFPVFEFYEQKRNLYVCGQKDVYWFFKERGKKDSYICPVTVFDQTESVEDVNIMSLPPKKQPPELAIGGPDTVSIGDKFTLYANAQDDFVFYSPDFGQNNGRSWGLTIRQPGDYIFYLYSKNSLAVKSISGVEKKEFDLSVSVPTSVAWNETLKVNITARNIGGAKTAKLRVDFNGFSKEMQLGFAENEEKRLSVDVGAFSSGVIYTSLSGNVMTTYSNFIQVEEPKKTPSILDNIIKAISDFFNGLTKISIK